MQTVTEEITSKENQFIKLAKSLHQKKDRNELNLFLIEGKNLLEEALKRNIKIKYLFYKDPKILSELQDLASTTQNFQIDEELLGKISTTENPPPLVAIAEKPQIIDTLDTKKTQNLSDIFLYCENIQDPGNLGSILRTAFAAGVQSIYLSDTSVDIYNSKVLRSSMGAVFCGSISYISLEELIHKLKEKSAQENKNLEIIGTSSHAPTSYQEINLNPRKNALVIVGNEAQGMSKEAESRCTQLVSIPLANEIESINVLAATSVILFSLNRQC